MVVASSNNGAVENISKELPQKEQVSERFRSQIGYFKNVAEDCIGEENWGILSAVMGNKTNQKALKRKLWFKKDVKNLQNTLKDDKIFDTSEWNKVKSDFAAKLKEVASEKKRLKKIKNECESQVSTEKSLHQLTGEHENSKITYLDLKPTYEKHHAIVEELRDQKKEHIGALSIIKNSKPGFLAYWFNKRKRSSYKKASASALEAYNVVTEQLKKESPIVVKLDTDLEQLEEQLQKQEKSIERLTKKFDAAKAAKLELKGNYADAEF